MEVTPGIITNTASVLFKGDNLVSNTVQTQVAKKITLVKSVSKTDALSGDILTYTIILSNAGNPVETNIPFTDAWDATQLTYVANSFTNGGVIATPTTTSPLVYTIPTIAANGTVTLTFQVTVN
jgi:uncharacterized repeat protein (TIGR01451 family)